MFPTWIARRNVKVNVTVQVETGKCLAEMEPDTTLYLETCSFKMFLKQDVVLSRRVSPRPEVQVQDLRSKSRTHVDIQDQDIRTSSRNSGPGTVPGLFVQFQDFSSRSSGPCLALGLQVRLQELRSRSRSSTLDSGPETKAQVQVPDHRSRIRTSGIGPQLRSRTSIQVQDQDLRSRPRTSGQCAGPQVRAR